MNSTAKILRPYQNRLLNDLRRSNGDALVEQPTGSGKTIQIVAFVGMELGRRFTHAVVAAPQEQIERGFTKRDYSAVEFPPTEGVAIPAVKVGDELILGARGSQLGSVRRLVAYLKQPASIDHAIGCTHAALNRLTPEQIPDDLSGKALIIDEAHHASADGLGELVALWRERGGQLYFFTATPYRGDGRPVALEEMQTYRRSLAEHMDQGFAPRILESEVVALGRAGDAVSGAQFTGEKAPPRSYFDTLVRNICRRWEDDGKPKAILRVPPMRGGSGNLVAQLRQALTDVGARVLDATGTRAEDKKRFLAALKAEGPRNYSESEFDVMIGIQRVLEGTDWPLCSAVYCVGMPGSLNTVVQLLGRAMRPKAEEYPPAHRDRARLVFFVPCAGGSALADLSVDHSRHALLTCCFLADHQVGQEWIVLREVRRGIEQALGNPADHSDAADAENEADEALEPEVRAEVELAIAAAREQLSEDEGQPTLGGVVELAERSRPDLPREAFDRVATEILVAQTGETGDKARASVRDEMAKRLRIDPRVKRAMQESFRDVLEEFREATLADSPVLASLQRQVHGVTGGQMGEFARRLRDAAPAIPLTEELILEWADEHKERTGKWPSVVSGPVCGTAHETWRGVDGALRVGSRGLNDKSSLAGLLKRYRGVRNSQDLPDLTTEQILVWVDAHKERTGNWPKQTTGEIVGSDGETWAGVNYALAKGVRGCPGASSLAELLATSRGVRNLQRLPPLTEEDILKWADEYFETTGSWPTKSAGRILQTQDDTWHRIDNALRLGLRTLPGNSSLAQLLADQRNVRHKRKLPELSTTQILAWADLHFDQTGEWPKVKAGTIPDSNGETWSGVNAALETGLRGLPGGSSLAKLLLEHRRVRKRPPLLTEQQILKWAEEHKQSHGEWPNASSGPIEGGSGETWARINDALVRGARGLKGESSLARFLAEKRGARNRVNIPELTVRQILAWADDYRQCTGSWPTQSSGCIEGNPQETWAGVNSALKTGSRGLPVEGSLAQLLSKYRGKRNNATLPTLSIEQILAWADSHFRRTGEWPGPTTGSIPEAPGETWSSVQGALFKGGRGLEGGLTLAKLLQIERGVRNIADLPSLSRPQILEWAKKHRERTGKWPNKSSGPIMEAPGETWNAIHIALLRGRRGLSGGFSLAKLIKEYRTEFESGRE